MSTPMPGITPKTQGRVALTWNASPTMPTSTEVLAMDRSSRLNSSEPRPRMPASQALVAIMQQMKQGAVPAAMSEARFESRDVLPKPTHTPIASATSIISTSPPSTALAYRDSHRGRVTRTGRSGPSALRPLLPTSAVELPFCIPPPRYPVAWYPVAWSPTPIGNHRCRHREQQRRVAHRNGVQRRCEPEHRHEEPTGGTDDGVSSYARSQTTL